MTNSTITAAALRWYTAHQARMTATTEKRKADQRYKAMPEFSLNAQVFSLKTRLSQAQDQAARLLTATKNAERRALRQLATACQQGRDLTQRADDASMVIDVLSISFTPPTTNPEE